VLGGGPTRPSRVQVPRRAAGAPLAEV